MYTVPWNTAIIVCCIGLGSPRSSLLSVIGGFCYPVCVIKKIPLPENFWLDCGFNFHVML